VAQFECMNLAACLPGLMGVKLIAEEVRLVESGCPMCVLVDVLGSTQQSGFLTYAKKE